MSTRNSLTGVVLAAILVAGVTALLVATSHSVKASSQAVQNSLPVHMDGSEVWTDLDPAVAVVSAAQAGDPLPLSYRLLALDEAGLRAILTAAPKEGDVFAASPTVIALPMPEGEFQRFSVVNSPIMDPLLAAKYPDIQTYIGQGIDEPLVTVRLGMTQLGFHAVVFSDKRTIQIDRLSGEGLYLSYFADERLPVETFTCGTIDDPTAQNLVLGADGLQTTSVTDVPALAAGTELKIYRFAVAATGEYVADAVEQAGLTNPTDAQRVATAMSAVAAQVNLLNGIYEREVSIRFILVAENDRLMFLNSVTDPYTDGDKYAMLEQNQPVVDSVIGSGNYDIGHVLASTAAGGGIASLYSSCQNVVKAMGVSGIGASSTLSRISVFVHEVGHQLGAVHAFNATSGSCGPNFHKMGAYEPGSGSTIMSYSGQCGPEQDLPDYLTTFHVHSYELIRTNVMGGMASRCGTAAPTGNRPPTVNAGPDRTIPARTPFELTGTASDPDGQAVKYSWQQMDLLSSAGITGTATLTQAMTDYGSGPLYRVYEVAASAATRSFPALSNVLAKTVELGEVYPTTNRTLTFRLFARDSHASGGGANYDTVQLSVVNTGDPFEVLWPGDGARWIAGWNNAVRWKVAGTNLAPINCRNVDIRLSTDGGETFPVLLAAGTPNDGEQSVAIPSSVASGMAARIRVQCSDNVFYNISYPNFTILGAGDYGVIRGVVSDQTSGSPLKGIPVSAVGNTSLSATTDANGAYELVLPTGNYTVTVAAYGYQPAETTNIAVNGNSANVPIPLNIALQAQSQSVLSGKVLDQGNGWGIGATIELTPGGQTVLADPITGEYSVLLYDQTDYTATTTAYIDGYLPFSQAIRLSGAPVTAEIVLAPRSGCAVGGYSRRMLLDEGFEGTSGSELPPGWVESAPPWADGWVTATEVQITLSSPPMNPHNGQRMVYFDSYQGYAYLQSRLMPDRAFDLTSTISPHLGFWLYRSGDFSYLDPKDKVQVKVCTAADCGPDDTWTNLGAPIFRTTAPANQWIEFAFDLGGYTDQSAVRVALEGISDNRGHIPVDDIVVSYCETADNNAYLALLSLDRGALYPSFDPDIRAYTVTVPTSVESVTVQSNAIDPEAIIQVNGAAVSQGGASAPINLAIGANQITVQVNAKDGVTTRTYSIEVNRLDMLYLPAVSRQ